MIDLHQAIGMGSIEAIKRLLKENSDVNTKDKYGMTPMYQAVFLNDLEIVKLLLECGADVNVKYEFDNTLLHFMIPPSNVAMIALLLANGADINAADYVGQTPLFWALRGVHSNPSIIKLLLKHGADVNAKDKMGQSPLHYANHFLTITKDPHTDIIKLLIQSGADVNTKDDFGITPLHIATESGFIDAVKVLLEGGAKVDNDALLIAQKEGHTKIYNLLSDAADNDEKEQNSLNPIITRQENNNRPVQMNKMKKKDIEDQEYMGDSFLKGISAEISYEIEKILEHAGKEVAGQYAIELKICHKPTRNVTCSIENDDQASRLLLAYASFMELFEHISDPDEVRHLLKTIVEDTTEYYRNLEADRVN